MQLTSNLHTPCPSTGNHQSVFCICKCVCFHFLKRFVDFKYERSYGNWYLSSSGLISLSVLSSRSVHVVFNGKILLFCVQIKLHCIIVVQLLSHLRLFATLWTAASQASLSFTISQSLLKFMSIELIMTMRLHISPSGLSGVTVLPFSDTAARKGAHLMCVRAAASVVSDS